VRVGIYDAVYTITNSNNSWSYC